MNETVDPNSVARATPASPNAAPEVALAPALKRYRLGRIALAVALAAALIAIGLRLENIGSSTLEGSRPEAASGTPPQTVRAAAAVLGDMPITIDALGTVTPLATVTVKTQISGKLMEIGYQEGQLVKEGDFLVQIDQRPFEATLAQAQGQLAKDTALYQQAQADFARYQTLVKQDSISHQQVEDQAFLVTQDKAAMASDQAQIDAAKLNISYAHIVSPITGRVGLRLVDAGNYVQPTDATGLVVITQLDPISVIFSTPEDNWPRITQRFNSGAKLPVTAFDRSNIKQLATGALTTFDNEVDTSTGTFKLRATFPNPDNALFPSQFVNVRLLVDTISGAVLVPNAAVQIGAPGSFVYVVNSDDTVAVRNIVTGPADSSRTVVASGLAAGEKVVIDGADRLREGSKVRPAPSRPDASQAKAEDWTPSAGGADPSAPGEHRHRRDGQGANASDAAAGPVAPTPSPNAPP